MGYKIKEMSRIKHLYNNWEETMIYSCLEGIMGEAYVDNIEKPESAVISLGGFEFFAGQPNVDIVDTIESSFRLLVPNNKEWEEMIELVYPQATKIMRYALKKEPNIFDKEYLQKIVDTLGTEFEIRLIDEELYHEVLKNQWSMDLCINFDNYESYAKIGLGVVILHEGTVVAGASSYTRYKDGIEIEIDTRRDYRRQGLASICGAKLILKCLERNLYPSWDAHNLGSLALAKKLGYHFDKEYVTYEISST